MRIRKVTDFYFANRIQIGAIVLLIGCALAGIPIPLPTGGSIMIPIAFPALVLTGKILAGIGATMGGVGMLTKWLKLAPSQADKLAKAAKEAARSGAPVRVQTPPGEPDVTVLPVDPRKTRPQVG